MFQLGKTIVSEDIIEKDFVCNLSACKGACCVDGEAGAPLDKEEAKILEEIYPKVKPFLRKEGIAVIEKEGTWVTSEWGELETPLLHGKDCAYVIFDEKDYSEFSAVNYHKWEICDDACTLGKELQVPVYKFVKQALVRKFGQNWYDELEKVAEKHLKTL